MSFTMKYKVGDKVVCDVETRANGKKAVVAREIDESVKTEEREFLILAYDDTIQTYMILIDDDLIGWYISTFHEKYLKVNPKFLGKKFYDVREDDIIRRAGAKILSEKPKKPKAISNKPKAISNKTNLEPRIISSAAAALLAAKEI